MQQLSRILSSIAVAAVFMGASPAGAQYGTPVYNSVYYSDATHQTAVGYKRWSACDFYDQPQFELTGSYSQYEEPVFIGYCQSGRMTLGPMPPE